MRIITVFLAVALGVNAPAIVGAQEAPAAAKTAVASPQACGQRGKNGIGRCLLRLRLERKEYCDLRRSIIDRYGPREELKRDEEFCKPE